MRQASMVTRAMVFLCVLGTAMGCLPARMRLPAELAMPDLEMPVRGRQGLKLKESLDFGPYRVTGVRREWTSTTSIEFMWFRNSRARQRFEYFIQELDARGWHCHCATGVEKEEIRFEDVYGGRLTVDVDYRSSFLCTLEPLGTDDRWWLAMGEELASGGLMEGTLIRGETVIDVAGSNALEGSDIPLSDPTGYVFTMDGATIAAVEVINDGAVWLHPALSGEPRAAVAAAAAALLLYRDIGA
ncbi:hypothetical protein JW905_09650 [bacterium]|nr:hypothetical protein [candidate division CSSED10-310 bacterium]